MPQSPSTLRRLVAAGILRRPKDGVRLLGHGEIKAKLALTVDHASASAKAAIEKAGGSIKLIVRKVLPADVAKREKTAAKKSKADKPDKKPAAGRGRGVDLRGPCRGVRARLSVLRQSGCAPI